MRLQYIYLALAIVGSTTSTQTVLARAPQEPTTIRMTANGFEPSAVTVGQGSSVVFKNEDSVDRWPASNIHPTHEIYSEFDPREPITPGTSWTFTFTKSGTWKMHDHLLPQFSGTITVNSPDNTPEQNNKGINLWGRIKAVFLNLWYRVTHLRAPKLESNKGTNTADKPQISKIDVTTLDNNITQDNEQIFYNDTALAAYIYKYGAKQTILQLNTLATKRGTCHPPAHRAGHLGYQLLGSKALIEYSPECQSGYYHGVIESYFQEHGTENLQESLTQLCPLGQNSFFDHQCIHGIGHGFLAWANYELPDALAACDKLPRRKDSCWSGAFMENIAAQLATGSGNTLSEKNEHITKYLKADDPLYPCNAVEEIYQNSCYFLQPSRMVQIFGPDFQQVALNCEKIPNKHQYSCFASMGREVSANHRNNAQAQINQCNYATSNANKQSCQSGAVQNAFWDPSGQDAAILFCVKLHSNSDKTGCYNTIINRAVQLLDKDTMQNFCNKLENSYIEGCNARMHNAYN